MITSYKLYLTKSKMAAVQSSECPICCESFNKSTRRAIVCCFDSHTACGSCVSRYLLDSIQEAHCMSCKKAWSLDFMNANFPQSFLKKEYREKRELVYFKEEETHFPGLLEKAEVYKKKCVIDEKIDIKRKEHTAN